MIKKSILREFDSDPECKNDFMTWGEFLTNVSVGHFTDKDGFGELASVDMVTDLRVRPSEASRPSYKPPEWATHVCWNNF